MIRKPRRSAAETRDSILTMAERLFREKGLAAVSIADIAAELNMSRANVFKHFNTRAILVDAVVERQLCANTARFLLPAEKTNCSERLEYFVVQLLESHLADFAQSPFLFDIVIEISKSGSPAADGYKTQLKSVLQSIIQDGMDEGRYTCRDAGRAADLVTALLSCVLHPLFIARDHKDTLLVRAREIVAFIDAALRNNAC